MVDPMLAPVNARAGESAATASSSGSGMRQPSETGSATGRGKCEGRGLRLAHPPDGRGILTPQPGPRDQAGVPGRTYPDRNPSEVSKTPSARVAGSFMAVDPGA